MIERIIRSQRFGDIIAESHYTEVNGTHYNTFYLKFRKSDYPNFKYPVNNNYYESDFADLPWHGGITFYEESITMGVETIKVGCDFNHYWDEGIYDTGDNGIDILNSEGIKLYNAFKELYNEMDTTFNPVNELHCDLYHACNDWLYENFDANIGINWDTIDEMIADGEIKEILNKIGGK